MKANKEYINQFVKDRNEALFSFDKEKIIAYFRKYDIPNPYDVYPQGFKFTDKVFWGAVAKSVCHITDAPKEALEKARQILKEYGWSEEIK